MSDYSEDVLIEQPAIALFAELGWETVNAFNERLGAEGTLGRETRAEVVLTRRLRAALERLNPGMRWEAIEGAVEELARDRSALSPAHANQEVYRLLKDGVKVEVRDEHGDEAVETVRVVDWNVPERNDFLLVSQFWMTGPIYTRRADLVGFVNGLPLVLIELKATHRRMEDAYRRNLRDYTATIPQLFQPNALIILSNGSESRVGSVTAGWEHFNEWKKINAEGEEGVVSLETMIRGTCEPSRLLDLIENFTLFTDVGGAPAKLIAKNHQFLGVNNAVEALRRDQRQRQDGDEEDRGRLGVFWHTQGSGKSYSMIFFSQKILRKLPGNYTFLIVTDRKELDDQIYENFAGAGAVTEQQVQAESSEHLKQLLREDHRNVFTLIQKFRSLPGEPFPMLSERSDIVVITDEAHRSQYDVFAMNMRRALPNAAFIGFTGTPLMAGEEKTREVFGDYVSIYNFRQSVEDGATVPLYYENRIPELQLTNEDLNEELESLIEQAALDEDQERRLEREFTRQYHLITRDDRLDRIAEDIVSHFLGRFEADPEQAGKAMVVSIDKATVVKMYAKVQHSWRRELDRLEADLTRRSGVDHQLTAAKLAFMRETDMAVVVSPGQDETETFRRKGLDIWPHRRRMEREALDDKFKNPDDPLRIVFVCAMWLTGFDVPNLATVYLDKPMRNHTLMQTIARANRVFPGKSTGLIVDYIGVFQDLQQALAIYGSGSGGGVREGETPVKDKSELVEVLRRTIEETVGFLSERGVEPARIHAASGLQKVGLLDDAVDAVLVSDESKKRYLALASAVAAGYKAILPDPAGEEFGPTKVLLDVIATKILNLAPPTDIDAVMDEVGNLLDRSVAAEGYSIQQTGDVYDPARFVDLSALDVDGLKAAFVSGRKHVETERLKGSIERALTRMVELNKTRTDYLQRFQDLIDAYNAGSKNIQLHFEELLAFAQELNAEDQRRIAENLSEEELAIFDLLTKPDPGLTEKEAREVKKVARDLLATLKREKLVLDWRQRQRTRAEVQATIQRMLDEALPAVYSSKDYEQRCEVVYQHVYDAYYGQGRSIYGTAPAVSVRDPMRYG